MKAVVRGIFALALGAALLAGCGDNDEGEGVAGSRVARHDGAVKVAAVEEGSLQNPAWSPEGDALLLTAFRDGYNAGAADLIIADLETGDRRVLVSDGSANVNLPGASWNAETRRISFSSSRDPHDEIFVIDEGGAPGDETPITARKDRMAYEPTFSPDGLWIAFESHLLDQEGNGIITRIASDGRGGYVALTGLDDDCRQPNWSPSGDRILYQRLNGGQWDIWVIGADGSDPRQVTAGPGDKTDASFSPDGRWIVYSSDQGGLDRANLFVIPAEGGAAIRATDWEGYDGAPSWSPDGKRIAFESCSGDPDESRGTAIWIIDVPVLP